VDWDAGGLGKWKYLWRKSTSGEYLELVELPGEGDAERLVKEGGDTALSDSNLSEGRSAVCQSGG